MEPHATARTTNTAESPEPVPLQADRDQLLQFIDNLFLHAGEGGTVSLRAFYDDALAKKRNDPPYKIVCIRLNGSGLEPLIDAAEQLAGEAASAGRPVVFAPPIATFRSGKAAEKNLLEGLVLSVELDARAAEGLATLRAVLGPPTLVVASGGLWTDPDTGEAQDKLHLHWRLKEPTCALEEHQRLKRARTLACELVGADGTCKSAVHPMRWPGSWHRKNLKEPRLTRIVERHHDSEISLEDALAELEGLTILRAGADQGKARAPGSDPAADGNLLRACAELLTNPLPPKELGQELRGDWDDWNRIGMAFWRASGGSEAGFAVFDIFSRKSPKYCSVTTRARWEHYRTSPPSSIGVGTLIHEARRLDPTFRVPRAGSGHHWSAGRGSPRPDGSSVTGDALFDLSHDGLALDLGREWAKEARYVAVWGRWLFWTGARWEPDEKLLHLTRTRDYLRRRADSLVRAASGGGMPGVDVEKAEAIAKTLRSAQTVAHVTGLARSNDDLAATVTIWDADPWMLSTPAGLVDLRTGALKAPDPLTFCTKCTIVSPAPAGTPAPVWQAFLERIFRHDLELIAFMQRALGYALTGLTTEHVLLFAWGQGGNGKGVLLNTAARILGDYAAVAPSDLLLVTQSDRHPCDMAMLRGARLATAQELAPGRAWDEPKLKSLTGGDPITARFIRQDFFTYEPQFTLILAGNHKPGFKSVDEAIRRRVLLVPFLQNIPEAERNKNLAEELKAEWPAILRWMIDGCLAWQQHGLAPPASVREASEDYLAAEDVLGQWLEERCVIAGSIEFTRAKSLYTDWKGWCEQAGLPAGSAKAFSQRLSERGFRHERKTAGAGFAGLGLRAAPQHEHAASEVNDAEDVGYEGCSDIGRKARAHAYTHDTSYMGATYTSYMAASDEIDDADEVTL